MDKKKMIYQFKSKKTTFPQTENTIITQKAQTEHKCSRLLSCQVRKAHHFDTRHKLSQLLQK